MAYILANDGIDPSAKEILEQLGHVVDITHYDGADLEEKIKTVECIVVRSNTKVRKPLLDIAKKYGKLKLIIRAGVGMDNIDCAYATDCGISVHNTPHSSANAVAELTIGHMLSMARHIYHANVSMRQGLWLKKQYVGIELAGKQLGLIGFGRIAQSVAQKAIALGMKVSYYSIPVIKDAMPECTYVTKEKLLKTSDFISLHIPHQKDEAPFISKKEFDVMKKGTYLINTARGGVVDEEALLNALDQGIVAMAALDVYQDEPTKNARIYTHDLISLTPHIGASTFEAQQRIGLELIEIIKKYL